MVEQRLRRIWERAQYFLLGPYFTGFSHQQQSESVVELVTVHVSKLGNGWQRQCPASDTDQVSSTVSQHPRWITGVYACARLGACVFLINVISISVAAGLSTKYGTISELSKSKVIYRGSCSAVKKWDVAVHLIINVLSTSILGASNYCMQSLVAPTREEIDVCHAKGEWLDIGTASWRNLFKIGRLRVGLWIILMITATPFHTLYNSVIFESIGTNEFGVFIGPQDLTADNIMNLTTPMLEKCFAPACTYCDIGTYTWNQFSSEIAAGNFTRISLAKCKDIIADSNAAGTKALMILVKNLSVGDGGNNAIQYSSRSGLPDSDDEEVLSIMEASNSTDIVVDGLYFDRNHTSKASEDGQNFTCVSAVTGDTVGVVTSDGDIYTTNTAQDCIQIPAVEKCQLLYSPTIATVVSLCSLVKVIAMFFAARISRFRSMPLLTLGDAVVSFMTRPDPTTEGMCAMSKSDVSHGLRGPLGKSRGDSKRAIFRRLWGPFGPSDDSSTSHELLEQNEPSDVIQYKKLLRRKWYMQVPSIKRWAGTLFLCCSYISFAGFLLEAAIRAEYGKSVLSTSVLSEWWSEGLGSSNYNILIEDLGSMIGTIMFANIPQLLLTVSYYCLNNVVTDMLAAAEYNSYGVTRKPLRVSRPQKGSQQKSTYWLSVPYQYGVPLLLLHMLLHWLISQSLYYVLVIPYTIQGEANYTDQLSSVGWSPLPVFLAILVGSLLVFLSILLGCKRHKSNMPLARGCSAAISAACHPPKGENLDTAALGPVRWGQTMEPPIWAIDHPDDMFDGGHGHCSFTALETVNPTRTKLYA